ncbi:Transmembrane channel-like protein 3 [Collichthys lucidus]|uniref:Transmembrane channel-like protein n=1 Tax=Collichthys lucidus TaxID=240159 RepID=A0A4U5U9C3_COLLU|nr:Transmembrane channel-like protein 3 [Collichthys lucidus]
MSTVSEPLVGSSRSLSATKRHKSVRKNSRRIYSAYQDHEGSSDDEDKDDERVDSNDPEEMFQNIQHAREIVLKYEGRLTRTRGYQTAGADLLKKLSRVLYNVVVLFIPWEVRIKKIESVASYFIFLRWLFGINIVLTIMTGAFIVLPELLAGAPFGTTRSKTIPKEHLASAQDLDTIWVRKIGSAGYRLPLAYFLVGMAVFAYSFIILLRKMAKNSRLSLASASDENFTFCWRVFCAWDYLIGNPEAAESKGAAIVNNIREAIVEEQEKKKDTSLAVLISLRILANILVLLSLAGSIYIIYFVVDRSQKLEQEKPELTLWEKNEVSVVVSLITMIAPSAFELVAQLEMYHPRTSLRFQLARVLVLYLGNLYSLIIALLDKVNSMSSAVPVNPGNWSDSSAFLATISQPEVDSLSTLVSDISVSEHRNSTIATIATVLDVTNSGRSSAGTSNQTALFEKNTRSQQDQCWETYVGQEMLKLSIIDMIFTVASILLIDFIRGLVVRYLSDCCCWDLESKFIKQFLFGDAAVHALPVYAAHHLCHCEIQTVTALWTFQATRLQAPEQAAADKKPDQQESDVTSQEASVHTPSPRRNGSVTNFQSPVRRGNSIRTITQSASRADLNRGSVAGSVRSPAVTILPKHRLEHIPNRPPPFLGGPGGTCRSKSYHHMAYNPPARYPDNIHSDPLCRKTVRSIHPVEAAGIITAQSYAGRRGHTTRYLIVNEHEPRKKLLRSATRVPRHYLMEESAEILELYPRNIKRYAPRNTHHQLHPHRSHPSQQHLSEEEEEEEEGKGRRRVSLGKAHRPRSLSDLHQPAHFYIGERAESHVSMAKDSRTAQRRYGVQEEDEEEDGEGELDWGDLESHSRFQANVRGADPLLVQTRRHIHSPGRHFQSPARTRPMESHVKPKTRPKLETPLTESDSASLASSSDQQNSSTDQYIQVIHNKERYLKSEARHGKLAKKKSKTGFDINQSESHDLVSSNV